MAIGTTMVPSSAPLQRVRFKHREFVKTLTQAASGADERVLLKLQPGSAKTFPWLSSIAMRFEKYRFHKLRFTYIAECPTTVSGAINMIPDYDPEDDNSTMTVPEMMSFADVVRTNAWKPAVCQLQTGKMPRDTLFTRNDDTTPEDIRLSDSGSLLVQHSLATSGPFGSLWVDYDVSLCIPQQEESSVPYICNDYTPGGIDHPFATVDQTKESGLTVEYDALNPSTRFYLKKAGTYLWKLIGRGTNIVDAYAQLLVPGTTKAGDSIEIGTVDVDATETEHVAKITIAERAPGESWAAIAWAGVTGASAALTKVYSHLTKVDPNYGFGSSSF